MYRSVNDRAVLGICGGIGEYLDIDPIIVRLIVVILTLLGFSGLLFYIVAIFIIPENPEYRAMKEGTYRGTTYEYTYGGTASGESKAGSGMNESGSGMNESGSGAAYDYEVGPDGEVKEVHRGTSATDHKDLSDYGREHKKNRNGNGAVILGLCLIAIGAFVLLKMFLPWIDSRLFLALALIAVGILVIAKR